MSTHILRSHFATEVMMACCFRQTHSPCIQSPMKKKVEAFERHALQEVAQQSPVPVRSTRTKTRAQDPSIEEDVESAVQKAQRSLIKAPSTPNLAWKSGLPAPSTPQQRLQQFSASLSTLNGVPGAFHSANAPKRLPSTSSATSKLAHMNRPASAKAPSVAQRESSAEDVRRGLKDLADEKRRKREEKLKQVQLQRELREKERAEKYAKQLQEKEEKAQQEAERKRLLKERKDKEAEQKAAQDKIQRQVKMQAAKDAERAR